MGSSADKAWDKQVDTGYGPIGERRIIPTPEYKTGDVVHLKGNCWPLMTVDHVVGDSVHTIFFDSQAQLRREAIPMGVLQHQVKTT
jgi:hypothetical protein